ncbi:MAG: hypothetical protein ACJ72W_06670 [Actinoallomurus sp.]|jgi:hypothetical protein
MSGQLRLPGTALRRRVGRVRRGLDDTVRAMRQTGRLEAIDAGLLALARVAADELDDACRDTDESRYTRATLIGRYATVLDALVNRDPGDDLADLADLFAEDLDTPPP